MNKENAAQTPHPPSPEITEEQKARISQKFRAAKALLARKRPFDNLLKTGTQIGGGGRVALSGVQRNATPLVPAKCGRTSEISSVKRPYCAAISTPNQLKDGDRTGVSRVPLREVHINTPSANPPKCGIITKFNSMRSCPERISSKRNDYCVSYGPQLVDAAVEDEPKSALATTSVKQNDFSEETPKKSDIDSVNYGSCTEAPVEDKSVSSSFITPLRHSECADLSDAFSSAADLDEVFDESILQQIDALCEERSGRKLKQHDAPHGDLSGESQCKENSGMTITSLGSLNVGRDVFADSGDLQSINTGNFPKAYSDYLQSLNDQQKEAACCDISTPLMIVAGPGSGKTSTMVGRVLMLLNEGIGPTNILATTFTTAAASEMRDRIGTVAGKEVAKQLTISTFHSFCLQLCRTHAEKLGRTAEFLIYGHGQQRRAIIEAVRLFESKKNMDENLDASKLDQYGDMSCAQHFKDKSKKWQKFVTQAKASGRTPADCRKMGDEIGAMILENYDGILRSCNALDYHDLISCSVSLLTDFPGVCGETQDLWKAMVIDEFQDTSAMQYNLLRILASHNRITIVGDEDQSIFSFNGADVSGFDSFRKDFPNHKEVRLTKNYRSTRIIVEAASSLIRNNVNRCQIKQALTDNCSGCKITVKECHNEDAQCAFVIDKILEFTAGDTDTKTSFGNIAILYRRQVSGKVFQTAFRNRKIPFNIHGVAFYRKKIIKAIMAMLRTTLPGCDDSAFRLTFKAILSVEKEEKKKIIDYIDRICTIRKCSFISAARDIFAAKISGTFKRSQLSQGRKVLSTLDIISKLVHREQSISAVITSVSNLLPQKYLLEQRAVLDADGGKLLNEDNDLRPVLQYLLDDVSNFMANHFRGADVEKNSIGDEKGCTNILKAFIDYISLRESENFRSRRQDNKDSVTLTTIHQSKGLEWDTVFIVKANDSEIPLLHEFNGSSNGTKTSLEEERRLLYVAMTRARKKLYILYVTVDSNWQLLRPSRFLKEIPDHLREVQTELSGIELQNMHGDLSKVHVEINGGVPRPEKLSDIETGAVDGRTSEIVSNELVEPLESCSGDSFLKSFNVEDRAMISHLFHQWARKKAFKEPKRLLDKVGFVIDERLRIKAKKSKDVLCTLKSRLSSAEAFQYAENILRWEELPAEKRAHLTREKQEHFQRLRIETAMGSSEATPKQVAYLQSLGCTVAPTSRLHASHLIEQYKSL